MKPTNLVHKTITKTKINDYSITRLEIDLVHINYGMASDVKYNNKQRSNYSADDIATAFESLDGLEIEPHMDNGYEYFVYEGPFPMLDKKKLFRMVWCIESGKVTIAGIITFFKITRIKRIL